MSIDWKQQIEQYRESFIETLVQFLSIPSVEDPASASDDKPFGEGISEALLFMLRKGEADGFKVKNVEGYAGYIQLGEGEEEVGVLAHVDVVPPGDGWTHPPFEPHIEDGKIYARGAIDDKGPAVSAYFAMKLLQDSGLPLSKRVRFILGTDEESGWLCMKRYGELEKLPDIGFSPDAEFPIIHAEKGQLNPVITLRGETERDGFGPAPAVRLLSFTAGERINVVPEEAAAVVRLEENNDTSVEELERGYAGYLQSHGLQGRVAVADRTATFVLRGRSAHGMEPEKGINAGTYLAVYLQKLDFQGLDEQFLNMLADVLHKDDEGFAFGIACEDEVTGKLSLNTGVIRYDGSGESADRLAELKLNIRFPATVDGAAHRDLLVSRIEQFGWQTVEVELSNAHHVPKDHPFIQTLQRVYSEMTGTEAELLTSGGATYARTMSSGVAFGPLFPGRQATYHEVNEHAWIDDLLLASAIYAKTLYELAK